MLCLPSQESLPGVALGEDSLFKLMISLRNPCPSGQESLPWRSSEREFLIQIDDFLKESLPTARTPIVVFTIFLVFLIFLIFLISWRLGKLGNPVSTRPGVTAWRSSGRGFLIQIDDFLN